MLIGNLDCERKNERNILVQEKLACLFVDIEPFFTIIERTFL